MMQNKIWITSDWHFNHNKEFIWKARGFSSVEEMNEDIIKKYNSVITNDDVVYCLGDCGLGGSGEESLNKLKSCIERLNGTIIIIRGNHCTNQRSELYKQCKNVQQISYAEMIHYRKYHFYLSHYPTLTANLDDDKPLRARTINLCGHSHATDPFADWEKGCIYHCEVDAHNGFPISLDTIIENMKHRVQEDKARYDMQLAALKKCFDESFTEVNTIIQTQPIANCDKCISTPGYDCPGVQNPFYDRCPEGHKYQRDPPDGGYYS